MLYCRNIFCQNLTFYIHFKRIFMFSLTLKQKRKTQNSDTILTHKNKANKKIRILDMYNHDLVVTRLLGE
jgi:hypothetical protein